MNIAGPLSVLTSLGPTHSLISAILVYYSDISGGWGLVSFFRVNWLSIFGVNFLSSPFIPSSGGFG